MDSAGIIASESGQLSLFLCLFVLLCFLGSLAAFSFALASLVLDVLIVDIESLVDFSTQSSIVLDAIKCQR
jgi:hypothetical protein